MGIGAIACKDVTADVRISRSNNEFVTIWFWKRLMKFLGKDLVSNAANSCTTLM